MASSVFEMFSIGIGPSSSHTVGPMRAASRFLQAVEGAGHFDAVARVGVELFGSLGHTGKGHGSDKAILLGLRGELPETVDTELADRVVGETGERGRIALLARREIDLDLARDLVFHRRKTLPAHPNGLRFSAWDSGGSLLLAKEYYSVGGGFVVDEAGIAGRSTDAARERLPHPFGSGNELLERCRATGLQISTLMRENEHALRSPAEVTAGLAKIWETMQACVERGCAREGILPGGLGVRRRAAVMRRRLEREAHAGADPLLVIDWVNLYALAVNEENAAGGRVVTAPTNGAAGIIPAVLHYYTRHCHNADEDGVHRFLLTAAAIAMIYQANASISGAEVGCQGEVGVACSMAAAGLTEVSGGTPEQVENAAEIGMEHNLGLTCDPIGGLVQVPCIERNAMGAVKAINASRLALRGDGKQKVSLDKVIATMRQTGADMKTKYKETARGGLAVNIVEC